MCNIIFPIILVPTLTADCPTDFVMYNERCYGFITKARVTRDTGDNNAKTWKKARDECGKISPGYDLVVIQNEEENKFLQNKLKAEFYEHNFWIGLKEIEFKKQYVWVDESNLGFGTEFEKYPWKDNEPNNLPEVLKICRTTFHPI